MITPRCLSHSMRSSSDCSSSSAPLLLLSFSILEQIITPTGIIIVILLVTVAPLSSVRVFTSQFMGCCQSKSDDTLSNQTLLSHDHNHVEVKMTQQTPVTDSKASMPPDLEGVSSEMYSYLQNKGFSIVSALGKGKFSVVYRATYFNGSSTSNVALKVTNKPTAPPSPTKSRSNSIKHGSSSQRTQQEDIDASIRSEVGLLKGLNHRGIIKLFDFFEDDKHYFIAEELIEGQKNDDTGTIYFFKMI